MSTKNRRAKSRRQGTRLAYDQATGLGLTEREKIAAGFYPRYDGEMLKRKVTKVMGHYEVGFMFPSDEQWREIMAECEREYRFLGRMIISSAALTRMEENAHNRILWKRHSEAYKKYLFPLIQNMIFKVEGMDAPRETTAVD